jgi:catechol 2,3-dioxygenase-like lactoylglutathione lyase family enzyme
MITRIRLASVAVRDTDAAIDFYVNTLGFEVRADERFGPEFRWVEVAPKGAETGFTLVNPAWGDGFTPGVNTGIVLTAPDIDQTYADLSARGVVFTEPPALQPWGVKQAQFQDLDGNGFVLVDRE